MSKKPIKDIMGNFKSKGFSRGLNGLHSGHVLEHANFSEILAWFNSVYNHSLLDKFLLVFRVYFAILWNCLIS